MSSPEEKEALRIGNALNSLGHLAVGHPLEEFRRTNGTARLREVALESAAILMELVVREEQYNPEVVPRSADAKAALSQLIALAQSIDWNDAESMGRLKACARQALEAFGFGLPG